MKTHIHNCIRWLLLTLPLLLSTSCVHEWHEDDPVAPVLDQEIVLRLDFSLELPPYTDITYDFNSSRTARTTDPSPDLRYQILVFPEEENVTEPLYVLKYSRSGAAPAYIDVPVRLPVGNYRFLAWADYVNSGSLSDKHYSTDSWTGISLKPETYSGCDDTRDAFRGKSEGLTNVPNDRGCVIEMVRPMAKLKIISNDFDVFLERIGAGSSPMNSSDRNEALNNIPGFKPDDYFVVVRYPGFLPSSFNIFTNRPSDAILGVSFRGEFEYVSDTEVQLGFDYVFVNGKEALVDLAIDIYTRSGSRVASSPNMTIPLMRSHVTSVRGDFLTSQNSGAIGIYPGFDGSYDIIIE